MQINKHALWFFNNGIKTFPIKYKGKEPNCASWDDFPCTRANVSGFTNYGVRLGALAVADSDTPEVEAWVSKNLPATPFIVQTARGVHRYYRIHTLCPKFFHRAGQTIEFRNIGQYVVGPGSIHSTGAMYSARDWSWTLQDIPYFPIEDFLWDDRPPAMRGSSEGAPYVLPERVSAGERHDQMFRLLRSMLARGVETQAAIRVCHGENILVCQPPIDRDELERYLQRVAKHPDKNGFERLGLLEWDLAAGLVEIGIETNFVVEAVKSVSPYFDPNKDETMNDVQDVEQFDVTKKHQRIVEPVIEEFDHYEDDTLAVVDESELTTSIENLEAEESNDD